MSNTLDRLKALGDKLEQKLAHREDAVAEPAVTAPKAAGTSTPKESAVTTEAPAKKSLTVEKSATTKQEEPLKKETDYKVLAEDILKHMQIDPQVEMVRAENIHKLASLYISLDIQEKAPDFNQIFIYKAMNISGIGLKEEDFGEIREWKYCQIIAITYEPDKNGKKKAKNISLSYFGKAEKLEEGLKNDIMEFVLRWRYEKAFQNLDHYKSLLDKIKPSGTLF